MSEAAPDRLNLPGQTSRGAPGWVENRPPGRWFQAVDARELWSFRDLGFMLALKRFKVRYKQTLLGAAWAVLQPLIGVVVFSLIFGRLAGLPSDGLPYPLFVFVGLGVWMYFSSAVNAAAESLVEDRNLVTKTYFPRLLAPLASVFPGLVDLAITLAAVAVAMAIYGVTPPLALALLPVWALGVLLLAFAVGALLAALNALYRDVRYALLFLMQVWLFASPVVFPSSMVKGDVRYAFALNPMVGVIDAFRWSLLNAPPPPAADLLSLASAAVLMVVGIAYFTRVEPHIADQI